MGVRGLTTYIATNAERYLEPFELHDCDLVIDGDNLCIQLFLRSESQMGAFGGNYDHYFRAVLEFFALLRKCNVRAFVLLDGGYEKSKLRTVNSRLLGRIQTVKHIKANPNCFLIPLLMREVFVDALRSIKVPFMRCLFEADNEIAVLARKLDCPVLSYDSDFYIHNVKYVPYVTVNHKVYRKVIQNNENYEVELLNRKKKGTNRVLAKQGDGVIQKDQIQESYCYLDCSLYTIESLIDSGERIKPEMLPLFACLLGNDYIERKVLYRFYASMKVGKVSRTVSLNQRRIVAILKWLQHHTVASATNTILNQVREKHRAALTRQLQGAMYGYNCEDSTSYEYFGFEKLEIDDGDKFREYLRQGKSDQFPELETSKEVDEEYADDDGEKLDSFEEREEELPEEEEQPELQDDGDVNDRDEAPHVSTFTWEPWLVEIYQAAKTPRFVADLYHSGLYINYPQAEDIARPDSNEICYDILRYIFALLKSSKNGQNFKYLTRCEKVAQFRWIKFQNVELPEGVIFNTKKDKNIVLFRVMFEQFSNCKEIFATIQLLPTNIQLYFLCLIFWTTKSKDVTCIHIHALIVSLIQLQIVDKRLTNKSRNAQVFQKNQKSYLESQKRSFEKAAIQDHKPLTKQLITKLSHSVTKPEAILTYEILVPHFAINVRQQRKHSEFDRPAAHTFAELQAVVLNLGTLNVLLRYPYEAVRIHELYNGLFIHNMYQTLKTRADPLEYTKSTVYRYSGSMFAMHQVLYDLVLKLVPQLGSRKQTTKKKGSEGQNPAKQTFDGSMKNQ